MLLLTRQSFVPSFEVKLYLFINFIIISLFVDTSVYVSIFCGRPIIYNINCILFELLLFKKNLLFLFSSAMSYNSATFVKFAGVERYILIVGYFINVLNSLLNTIIVLFFFK